MNHLLPVEERHGSDYPETGTCTEVGSLDINLAEHVEPIMLAFASSGFAFHRTQSFTLSEVASQSSLRIRKRAANCSSHWASHWLKQVALAAQTMEPKAAARVPPSIRGLMAGEVTLMVRPNTSHIAHRSSVKALRCADATIQCRVT